MTYKQITAAKEICKNLLNKFQIKDSFMVRVKKPTRNEWVAMYRGNSQFTNNRGPIFWISSSLLDNQEEMVTSMLHEYGHVIAEWAWLRSPKLAELLSQNWRGEFYNRNWNEEEWAEDFAHFIHHQSNWVNQEAIKKVIDLYVKEVFEA